MELAKAKTNVRECGSDPDPQLIELRLQANYWRVMHARAVERETAWKDRASEKEEIIRRQQAEIARLVQKIADLEAKVAWFEQQFFGRKSEKAQKPLPEDGEGDLENPEDPSQGNRKRGKKPGAEGHGRRRHTELSTEEVVHDLPKAQRRCPTCGKAFEIFPGTEDSEEVHWDYRVVRRVHKRVRYRRTCTCSSIPGILAPRPPPKLIPKGLFSIGFWVRLLLEKFFFQRPLYRVCQVLALEGLFVSQGTLTGGLKRIGELLQPLYGQILDRIRAAGHWHMDETRWMVFVEVEGKSSHRWWLWVAVTQETCAYVLDPSRSADVPKNLLGQHAEGIVSADRYRVYRTLGEKVLVAFCWGHVRRDFIRIRNGYAKLRLWAGEWVARIQNLYQLNGKRLEVLPDPRAFRRRDRALRRALCDMEETREAELANETLDPAQRKALESLQDHWEGLTLFADHPQIPMDNNEAERRLRNPVVGRKNYYGSGSIWSGMLAASLFTIFQTLVLNRIDPQKFLLAYFEACALNGGQAPANIEPFLPWNLSPEQKAAWQYPERPP